MKLVILALVTGFLTGFIFGLLKLPIPAPGAFSGIVGIFGIYAGYRVFEWVSVFFQR
ncbi:XapX domain-containing protein [Niallia sp.]|uniref:XapX domain-containing protein n=1 Tax=Niallia sp. TaxID=2837523 RepID=UPI0028A29F18|nr:XapX domain-containing protein [Niallia sp.]